ncbi:hypothetical protein HW49_09180 [Porphyromonadaceae bacterium COT-184 OH4590]|nr:hypothetical protein HW49_09180 [Porphyromonadaceae bacterium COT-184 OH4590]
MNKNKSTIQFTGRAGLLYTDESGNIFKVNTEMLASKDYDMVIYVEDIVNINKNINLTMAEKKNVAIQIIELTKGIKWLIR